MNDDLHSEKNSFNLETHKANHVKYTRLSLLNISFVLNVTKAVVYSCLLKKWQQLRTIQKSHDLIIA